MSECKPEKKSAELEAAEWASQTALPKRVCAEPGCPELTDSTRCPTHTKAKDKARGTRQQRGYGKAHTKLRARWARKVAKGDINCWRCGQRLSPLQPWDLGHLDDRTGYGGPECLPCNRNTRTTRG